MVLDKKFMCNHRNVDKFKKEVIHPFFPNADFASTFMVSSPEELATSFEGKLSQINLFKNKYFYGITNKIR